MNNVPMRLNPTPELQRWGELRPYSLGSLESFSSQLPPCRNLDDYLIAIKYGQRTWLPNNKTSEDDERAQTPSTFIPHNCYAPTIPPSPTKVCSILDEYNHVIFHGDSLSRHLRQAIYMSIRGNYISGGLMIEKKNENVAKNCICDGQFSEARMCRPSDDDGSYFGKVIQPRMIPDEALCPNTNFELGKRQNAPWLTRKGKVDPGEHIDWNDVNCKDPNYKGILIVLQGGLHWSSNATETFNAFIQPVITHPTFNECLNLGKMRLVWLGMTAQHRMLDKVYEHQSLENAILFNDEIRQSFQSVGLIPGEEVLIMDWYNMTKNAQTSDGLHHLTDVNLAKAAQILYLVENWPFPYIFTYQHLHS